MSGDGKSTVVERPPSTDPDAKPTAVDRPPSTPHATGSRHPANEPAPRSTRRSLPPASANARYQSGEEIGRGGMGRVVEATDTLLDRRVAVKEVLTTDAELLRRFARETKITARLEHPSIVPVYDAGVVDGSPFYVMRRVTGRPLSELIRAAPSLAQRLALVPHILAAAQAIAHAHQRGIIHRDIKPSNILVGELGETVVIDWGLAKVIGEVDDSGDVKEPDAASSLRTRLGSVFGTPGFMDPNQLRGEAVGSQGDVYSLGASLYNLLAAEPPHYSNDSTQMMQLASLGPPTPIAKRVPGVPAELSTIVDTATSYDVTRRYADAGAFAEDLKRFLTGQLVASHRYSRTERFVRFVRQHRATVAVGTAAAVLVFVIGTFSISQVLGERDRADEQARLATEGRREAEAARAMADERSEQLLLSRASALVETNPTAAIASLKHLPPSSRRLAEAHAIISAARLRGVAWAIKADDRHSAYATLDQTGQRFAQLTSDGTLHVYDLEARHRVFEVDLGRGAQIRWVLDGKFLLASGHTATRMYDPSGREHATDLPAALTRVEVDEPGHTMVAIDDAQRAYRFDLVTGRRVRLAEHATEVAISADGAHAAVVDERTVTIFDRSGTAILSRAHPRTVSLVVFGLTKVAFIDNTRVYQAPLVAGGTFKLVTTKEVADAWPYWIAYSKDRLFARYTDSRLVGEWGGALAEIARFDATSGTMDVFGRDYMTVGTDGRRIHYVDGLRVRQFILPISLRSVRLAVRRDHRRLIAIGDGAIIVLDLQPLPELLASERYQSTHFLDHKTLLSTNGLNYDFGWYDLTSRTGRVVKTSGPAELRTYDTTTSRLLLSEQTELGRRANVYPAGSTEPSDSITDRFDKIQLVGDAVVYAHGNKVHGGTHGASRPELFTTDGRVTIVVRLTKTRFAVISERELVRYDFQTGAIERAAVPAGPEISFGAPYKGTVVFGQGDKVYRWDTQLDVFAKLEALIEWVLPTPHGMVVALTNHSTLFVDEQGRHTRLASTRGVALTSPNRVIVPGQFHYDVVELPSFARWALPLLRSSEMGNAQLDLSPDGTQLVEKAFDGRLWLWQLPTATNFTDALNATNLFEDQNGLLRWPWQTVDPPK